MKLASQTLDTIAYQVKPGDSLSAIIKRYYGTLPLTERQALIRQVQAANPGIKNPNLLHPNQLIKLDVPQQYCAAPPGYPYSTPILGLGNEWFPAQDRHWKTSSPKERDLFSLLAPVMLGSGTAKLSMIDTTFKTNSPLLAEVVDNYETYKRGQITKGQYDYRRSKLMSQLTTNLGPTNLLLNGTHAPTEVLRISRTKGTAPTQPITQKINQMGQLSRAASKGGVALSVVGLGIACHQIAHAQSQQKKNEILVESVGGLVGGVFYGLAAGVGIALMATPIGWVAALAIGLGSVAASYGGSRALRRLYDTRGRHIDFASKSGVASACSLNGSINTASAQRRLLSGNALSAL